MPTNTLATFDTSFLDKEESGQLVYFESQLPKQNSKAVAAIIELGETLIAVQSLLSKHGTGKFTEWLSSRTPFSKSSAYRAIAAAQEFRDCPNWDKLEVSAMYVLAESSTPEKARKEAFKLLDKGQPISNDDAKKLKAKHLPDHDPPASSRPPKKLPSQSDQPSNGAPDREPEPAKGDAWEPEETTGDGKPVSEQVSTQRSKTVKTVEALMRAFDDLNSLLPSGAAHRAAIASCKELLTTAKGWK